MAWEALSELYWRLNPGYCDGSSMKLKRIAWLLGPTRVTFAAVALVGVLLAAIR